MRKKGKNGQQISQDNICKVTNWVEDRNRSRDWEEYEIKGRINRSVVAQELDFARSVTTQNKEVRKILEKADELWFKSEPITKAAQEASIERSNALLGKSSKENNKLIVRIAELEAENRQLHKKLAYAGKIEDENRQLHQKLKSFKRMQSMIEDGQAGFKV